VAHHSGTISKRRRLECNNRYIWAQMQRVFAMPEVWSRWFQRIEAMSELLEGDERLERELTGEPILAPATFSVLLHMGLVGSIIAYSLIGGFFKPTVWGGSTSRGIIRVSITNAIPLPSNQPPSENVLATETPSPAPAPPTSKPETNAYETAIPIQGKHEPLKPQPSHNTPPRQPLAQKNNRAEYGEEAANNLPHAIQGASNPGPTSIAQGDFGSRFPWYVDGINLKMHENSNMRAVDPRTPKGTRAYILFIIRRDGTVGSIQMDKSSGSPTLDRECLRAAQRVDTFSSLPGAYTGSTLSVSYYCEN
jgi:protein TonB